MSKRKYYSDELAEAIKLRYDSSPEVITALMNEFDVPRHTISVIANKFELTKKKAKDWTSEELDVLKELWGHKTVPQIAKLLGRTETALIVKYKRLGMDAPTSAGDLMTARVISDLMKVDIHTVTDRWIPRHGLKAKKIAMTGVRKMTMVHIDDLIKWLKVNQNLWDSRRVELFALGYEPEWLKEKRKIDSQKTLKTAQKWTAEEDARAIALFKQGQNYVQIGKELMRSREAVERRMGRLDIWGSGKYVGDRKHKTSGKFAEMKELADKDRLITRFAELLLIKRNQIAFDGYWQKSLCMKWDDVKGCKACQSDCDSCTDFIRIREQYCKRCGVTFFKRSESKICDPCAQARIKQHQRKWSALNKKGGRKAV